MFGANPGHNLDREDTYGYDEEKLEWFERFDLRPVDPATVNKRVEEGEVLRTVDLPTALQRKLIVEPGTGMALYRLTQLFGTPNVDVWTAGSDMPDREVTTWQYLFDVTFTSADGEDRQFLLSVYDYKTDVSVGLSTWDESGGDAPVAAPTDEASAGLDLPEESFCEGLVQLTLNMLEEPVPATYEDLWI
jgi:hypothetical protein